MQEYTPSEFFTVAVSFAVHNFKSCESLPQCLPQANLVIIFRLVPVKLTVQSYSCWDTIRFLRSRLLARKLLYHYKESEIYKSRDFRHFEVQRRILELFYKQFEKRTTDFSFSTALDPTKQSGMKREWVYLILQTVTDKDFQKRNTPECSLGSRRQKQQGIGRKGKRERGDWEEMEGTGSFPFSRLRFSPSPLPLPFLRLPHRLARVNSVREGKVHKVYSMFSLLRTLLVEILTIGNNSH